MRKRLYADDERENYTPEGLALTDEAITAMQPLFDKYHALGFSIRDIQLVVDGALYDIVLRHVMTANLTFRKEEEST